MKEPVIKSYNFEDKENSIVVKMPDLKNAFAKIEKKLTIQFTKHSKKIIGFTSVKPKSSTYKTYAKNAKQNSLYVVMYSKKLKAKLLLELDALFVYSLVDICHGGVGKFGNIDEQRQFSKSELKVMENPIQLFANCINDGFVKENEEGLDFVVHKIDNNIHFINFAIDDDILIQVAMEVEINLCKGNVLISFPVKMLEKQ